MRIIPPPSDVLQRGQQGSIPLQRVNVSMRQEELAASGRRGETNHRLPPLPHGPWCPTAAAEGVGEPLGDPPWGPDVGIEKGN